MMTSTTEFGDGYTDLLSEPSMHVSQTRVPLPGLIINDSKKCRSISSRNIEDLVKSDVLCYSSNFHCVEDVLELKTRKKKRVKFSATGNEEEHFACEPCDFNERICEGANGNGNSNGSDRQSPFIFLYEAFFTGLKMHLPFSEFECDVLQNLNVAPSQLHPNSWGFVRAFQILSRFLGIQATASKFFYFFQVKFGNEVGWVSLSNIMGRRLLSLFDQSFKGFKKGFFKVRSPLFLDDAGNPKFPLYWTSDPRHVSGFDSDYFSLKEWREVQYLDKFELLDTNALIALENNPAELKAYLDQMARRYSIESLAEFLALGPTEEDGGGDAVKITMGGKGKSDVAVAGSNDSEKTQSRKDNKRKACQTSDAVEQKVDGRRKRRNEEKGDKVADKNVVVEEDCAAGCRWYDQLCRVEKSLTVNDPNSLWFRSCPVNHLADVHSDYGPELEAFRSMSSKDICKATELHLLRTLTMVRFMDNDVGSLEKKIPELESEIKSMKVEIGKASKVRKELESVKKELDEKKKVINQLTSENKRLKQNMMDERMRCKASEEQVDSLLDTLASKEASWASKERDLKYDIAKQFGFGFQEAIDQVLFLYPGLDVGATGMLKKIKDGKLVDATKGAV